MATGSAIKQADMELTLTPRVLDTRDSGRTTSNTAKAMKPGQREPATKANTLGAKKKDEASIPGSMGQFTKASGETTK